MADPQSAFAAFLIVDVVDDDDRCAIPAKHRPNRSAIAFIEDADIGIVQGIAEFRPGKAFPFEGIGSGGVGGGVAAAMAIAAHKGRAGRRAGSVWAWVALR